MGSLPSDLLEATQRRSAAVEAVSSDGTFTGRLVPYESPTELQPGFWEVFSRGSLAAAARDPGRVKVRGVDHERSIIGKAVMLDDRVDGLWGQFHFASTAAAQEARTLMTEGFIDELSIEFQQLPRSRSESQRDDGSWLIRHRRARLLGVSPVGHGAYGRQATVMSVRMRVAEDARREQLALLNRLRS